MPTARDGWASGSGSVVVCVGVCASRGHGTRHDTRQPGADWWGASIGDRFFLILSPR